MVIEQPSNIRNILSQIYSRMDERLFSSASKRMAPLFRRLVFVVCFFHASVLVRCQYESELCTYLLGANMKSGLFYRSPVTEHDLALAIETIRSCVTDADERNEEVSFATLEYTIAEVCLPYDISIQSVHYFHMQVIYGGHISEPWDMNSLRDLLHDLLLPLMQDKKKITHVEDKFALPGLPAAYATPPETAMGLEACILHYPAATMTLLPENDLTVPDLRGLPLYDSADVLGLGENVTREFLQHTTRDFLVDLATLSSSGSLSPSGTTVDQTLLGT